MSQHKAQLSSISTEDVGQWTVPQIASKRIAMSPDKIFVEEVNGPSESYAQFWKHAQAFAYYLSELGIQPGDHVVIFASNSIPALHAWMAAGLLGAVDVSVNTGFRSGSLQHVLSISQPKVIISDVGLLASLAELPDKPSTLEHIIVVGSAVPRGLLSTWVGRVAIHFYKDVLAVECQQSDGFPKAKPADLATIVFTSGTTGPAKGVMMPHAQVCLIAHQTIQETEMHERDVFYNAHPLFHIAGKFMGVLATLAAGGTLILGRKFDAKSWLNNIQKYAATIGIAHGPMIEMIYAENSRPDDKKNMLRRLMCCPLPKGIGTEFQERFGLKAIEMWGMSEIGCPVWTSRQSVPVLGSCGKILTEWYDVNIVDPETDKPLPDGEPGEIVVRPKHPWTTMLGYLGMPEETVSSWRNLWFHSGDMAYRDSVGNMFFMDRIGDRIRRRAENISSYDIEAAAMEHAGVKESAAVGIPSGYEFDDDIVIYVIPSEKSMLNPLDLLNFLSQRLPHFMVPRYIEILEEFPRTPTNKVKKKELRSRGLGPKCWDRKAEGVSLISLHSNNE